MIVKVLKRFFAPLTIALENRTAAMVLIQDLGWTLDEAFELDALEKLDPVKDRLILLLEKIDEYDPDSPDVGGIVEQVVLLAGDVQEAIQDLQTMTDGQVIGLISPLNTAQFWHELALDLPEYLILTYLRLYMPPVHALVNFGGAIVLEPRPDGRPDRETLDWNALGRLFTDPDGQVRDFYDWGGELRHRLLIERLGDLLRALGLPVRRSLLPTAIQADRYPQGGEAVGALTAPLLAPAKKRLPWDYGDTSVAALLSSSLDLILAPVPGSANGTTPDGLLLTLQAIGRSSAAVDLGDGWVFTAGASVDLSGALGVEFQPTGVSLASGSPAGSLDLGLSATRPEDAPYLLFGEPNKSRLELTSLSTAAGARAGGGGMELHASAGLDGLQVVIAAGDGDGFLSDVLDGAEVTLPIEFGLEWSSSDGMTWNAGAGVEIEIPVDRKLGPAHVQLVTIGAGVSTESGANIYATTAGSLNIGPFGVVVAGIGVEAVLTPNPRGEGGRKGAVTVQLGFKPPNEVGLWVDIPGVSGGGYLAVDREAGEYAGVLDISLFGFQLTAVGMIATRLPSGEEGWSLFLSISIIFPKGIPLVFGFSWTGVGGLIGVNRGIDIEALGDGVRAGSLDAVMFPDDPIANAPMILAALDDFFPAQKGQYAFGPIFQISWGAKGLVTIQLGLAIQLPEPLTISLLGSIMIRVGLPEKGAPEPPPGEEPVLKDVIRIRVDIAGTLWPTEGRLWIDAGITEGFIVGMNLSGDMAVRMEMLGRPNVVAAMGGFHPQFTPPEGFPSLNRLSFKIFDEPALRIGVESYLAISSNAFHFGVAAFFYAKALGFSAEGRFEFDTLINFRPFGMVASLGFQVQISAGSVDLLQVRLRGTLKGPKPWFVTGYAEFKVLGKTKKFKVEMTLGKSVDNGPDEVVALFDAVYEALGEAEAWTSEETDTALLAAVTFAAPAGATLFHPGLRVRVNQGVAPLGISLEKFGEAAIAAGEDRLEISNVRLGGDTALSDPTDEWFAPANFFEMSEQEKITAPSFEDLEAGRVIGSAQPAFAPADGFEMGHENIIIDPDVEAEWPKEDEDEKGPRAGKVTPALEALAVTPGMGLDLKPKRARKFTVTEPRLVVVDPARPAVAEPAASFTAAISEQRKVAARGEVRVIQTMFERELEEV